MGNEPTHLSPTEIENMKLMSNCKAFFLFPLTQLVSERELKRLHRRFKKLDTDGSGTLTIDEFMRIPELAGLFPILPFLNCHSESPARASYPNF